MEKQMEALKKTMLEAPQVKIEDKKSWFRCETCHIWKKEVINLKVKLDKALEKKLPSILIQQNLKDL